MENIECMDLMENLRYIDLIDQNDNIRVPADANDMQLINGGDVMAEELSPLDELGFMFVAWLKSNQPKRWTVGSDPNQSMIKGKRRLLEVVLEWGSCEFPFRYQEHIHDTSLNNNNMIFSSSNNICYQEPNTSPNHNTVCTMAKYHDNVLDSAHTCPASDSYPMAKYHDNVLDSAHTCPASDSYPANDNCFNNYSNINSNGKYSNSTGQGCAETADQVKNQYCYPTGTDNLVKLRMLITKAARKKRMEQRSRVLSKKNHYDCNRQIHNLSQNQNVNQQCRHGKANQANQDDRQARGWKSEKKLTLLLQKVLTRSDVNLGKIVLPKKEAETYLPELSISRNRIPISVKDVETSSVWNMHYRFWPNNNARMYILENTGGFVQDNLLQEGDIIMMYTDIKKNNKYFIRGLKRDKGIKISTKKPTKTRRSHGNNSCLPKSIH